MAPGAADSEPHWPPRSPHDVLMTTPGGRQRYHRLMNRTSPSPSPSKSRAQAAGSLLQDQMQVDDDEEEEDEETLQLKLQEIQARLKLKKLQNKTKDQEAGAGEKSGLSRSQSALSVTERRRAQRATTPTEDENARPASSAIQVAASPIRKAQAPQVQTSPSRVLLGIDKGLKAKDISLKRAPILKKTYGAGEPGQNGGYLRRSKTPNPAPPAAAERPMSFNERLASVRTDEVARAEKQKRIEKIRSNTFGIGKEEMETYKSNATVIPDEPLQGPTFTREEILSQPAAGTLRHSNTLPASISSFDNSEPQLGTARKPRAKELAPGDVQEEQAASFEPYSSFHLSKRVLPHQVLARHVSGKKVYAMKELLRVVKGPDFSLPDIEQDIVIFAIVAKKSEPRAHKPTAGKNGGKGEDRGKYMVMTLVDLNFELELFLFNSGFTQFWKLTEGTVVAILNPNIMPPPPGRQDTGRFSLVINSDADTIIEIGSARDLGACQSVKKDGQLCAAWVNKKKTQFCEFHSNEAIRKQRATRVEVNASGFGSGDRWKYHQSKEVYGHAKKKDEAPKKSGSYDWDTKTHYFTARSHSAADLIDGKDRAPADRKDKAEHVKRGLEAKERERDMMKKLGRVGNSAGREYMHASGNLGSIASSGQAGSGDMPPPKPDAESLGLLSRSSAAIHLSPVKRKRADSSQAGSVAGGGGGSSNNSRSVTAFGWGSGLRNKLSRMKDGEKLQLEEEERGGAGGHVRKKTRFVTAKGIREAGRESLGMDLADRQVEFEDDDDELIIVK